MARSRVILVFGSVLLAFMILALTASGMPGGLANAATPSTATTADAQNVKLVGHIGGTPCAVGVQGDYAYVGIGPRLAILDISIPADPTIVGQPVIWSDIVENIAVIGNYAYVAAGNAGLRIVDVSNPATPIEIGYTTFSRGAQDATIQGNYAYVAAGYAGLRIVDVSEPVNPTEISHTTLTTGPAWDIVVAGSYAYIAAGFGGLSIVDIANPAAPSEVSSYWTTGGGRATGVAVMGNYAYGMRIK